jgi:hypothetical protein
MGAMLLLLASLLPAEASGRVGLGLAVGTPTGATLKVFVTRRGAIDVLVGETWHGGWEDDDLMISVDYLAHVAEIADGSAASLDFYVGGGGNVWLGGEWAGDDRLAAEMPLGLSLRFVRAPVELFVEAVPMVIVYDFRGFEMGASGGARYYF